MLMGAEFKTRMYGCAPIGWLSTFHSKRMRKLEKKLFSDFFTLKVFLCKNKGEDVKDWCGIALNVLNFVFWMQDKVGCV